MSLDGDATFVLAGEVDLHIQSDGSATIRVGRAKVTCRSHVLGILDVFRTPRRFRDALDLLANTASSAADWMDVSATVHRLIEVGALVDVNAPAQPIAARPRTFERASQHICMLDDRARTDAFLGALREVVRPDDVVVDIGTGTGVLAIGAARAGARHVFGIEAGATMAAAATRIVEASGFADRVTIVHGWSTAITLPEPASLVVSETIGSDALDEEILATFRDARRRLLTDTARMLPSTIDMFGVAVEIPRDLWQSEVFTGERTATWRDWYGTDFAPLASMNRPARLLARRIDAKRWRRLTDRIHLGTIELGQADLVVDLVAEATAIDGGSRVGLMTFFELPLTSHIRFSQDPIHVTDAEDWPCPVWITPSVETLSHGERVRASYTRHGSTVGTLERIA